MSLWIPHLNEYLKLIFVNKWEGCCHFKLSSTTHFYYIHVTHDTYVEAHEILNEIAIIQNIKSYSVKQNVPSKSKSSRNFFYFISSAKLCRKRAGKNQRLRTFLCFSGTPRRDSASTKPVKSLLLCFSYLSAYSITSRSASVSRVLSLDIKLLIF